MRHTVKKWGNSPAIRIPAAIMAAARLSLDNAVDIRTEHGRIVIEPIRHPVPEFHDLAARITPENRHGEIDTGPALGVEAL